MSDDLNRTAKKTLREFERIMDMETDGDDANFSTVIRAKVAAGGHTLTTQTKVDENRLRAAVVNRLPELLETLRQEQILYAERRAQRIALVS